MSLRDLVLDPVVAKELSGSSRRWQTFAGRILYVAVIAVIVWNFTRMMILQGAFLSLSDYADLGRELFEDFLMLQLGVVTLGGVSAASDMITRETRLGTLALLSSTPLSPWRIAFGKWKAALAQTSTLLLCGAPVFAICAFLGGTTPVDLVFSLVTSVSVAALSSAVALYLSTVFRSGITVLIASIAVLALYTALPGFALMPIHSAGPELVLVSYMHPFFAVTTELTPRLALAVGPAWLGAAGTCALLVHLLLRAAASRIRILSTRPPEPPILTRAFEAMDRFYEGIGPERIRKIRLFGDGGEVWETRAVLWKELKTRSSGKLRYSVRIAVVLLVVLAAAMWLTVEFMMPLIWASWATVLFMAAANGVGLFVKEKEERKWDILLATPLSSGEILRAKLLAGVVPLAPVAGILLLYWTCLHWIFRLHLGDVFMCGAVLLLPAVLAYTLGAACSLQARSLRGAFMATLGVMVALLAVAPAAVLAGVDPSPDRAFLLDCISPAPYLETLSRHLEWGGSRNTFRLEGHLEGFLLYARAYGAACLLPLLFMIVRFNRIAGRT